MGRVKPDCNTCVYRKENGLWKCNYETVTGHTRLAVPANRCKHYKKGPALRASTIELMDKMRIAEGRERQEPNEYDLLKELEKKEKKKPKGRDPIYDWERAKVLYEEGKSDSEIGKELGCSSNTVRLWRGRCKLASNVPKGWHPEPKYDWEKARKLYDAGMSDARIAKALGCQNETVGKWRRREGLEVNKSERQKVFDWELGRKLYDEGKNDAQIAKALGCTDKAVRNWRFRRKLPANRVPGFLKKEEKKT